ncbi:hypothetical protein MMC15_002244 [Xylographa vitiligo]|nr:hypothetical protein [Xylographa vitiligo]
MDRPHRNRGTSPSSEGYEENDDFVVVNDPLHVKWDGHQTKYVPTKTLEATVAAAKTAFVESAKAAAGSALQVASTLASEVGERSGKLLSGGDRRDRQRRYIQERILEARCLRALDEGLEEEYMDESEKVQQSYQNTDGFEEAKLVTPGLGKDTGNSSSGMKSFSQICGEIANVSVEAGTDSNDTNPKHHGSGGS